MKKKIMLLVANPVKTSFSYSCGNEYEKVAKENGAEIRRLNIDEMKFDACLHQGYEVIQELEEDLVKFQEAIKWADHLVFIYPNWWNTMPAKMKGLFDRAFLPGFAFSFGGGSFKPLLKGKSARIINIVGSMHPMFLFFKMGSYTNELSKGILEGCGVAPVCEVGFGPTRNAKKEKLEGWIERVKKMAIDDVK